MELATGGLKTAEEIIEQLEMGAKEFGEGHYSPEMLAIYVLAKEIIKLKK